MFFLQISLKYDFVLDCDKKCVFLHHHSCTVTALNMIFALIEFRPNVDGQFSQPRQGREDAEFRELPNNHSIRNTGFEQFFVL